MGRRCKHEGLDSNPSAEANIDATSAATDGDTGDNPPGNVGTVFDNVATLEKQIATAEIEVMRETLDQQMTMAELQQHCVDARLSKSGTKPCLLNRLRDNLNEREAKLNKVMEVSASSHDGDSSGRDVETFGINAHMERPKAEVSVHSSMCFCVCVECSLKGVIMQV